LLARQNASHHTSLAGEINMSRPAVAQYVAQNGGVHSPSVLAKLNSMISDQSAVLAYADTARATAYITLLITPLVLMMRRPKRVAAPLLAE
jgi:hypothetical protein